MRFPKRIFSTLATISLTTSFGLLSANASTKATTPMLGYRYDKQAANYQDLSSSDYYKDVWNNATASWKKAGFTWTKAATAKTTVSSYDGSSDMTLAGYNSVSYNKSTGEITSSKVRINRAVFEKYNYTKAERTNVAEHELGHALGIGHNNTDSVSVMNPANRYYTIQACDINGMKARYATTTTFDSVPNNPGEIITVTEYLHVQPKITNITTNYSSQSHSLILKGRAIGIEHLTLTYQGKKVRTVNVKSGQFKFAQQFKGYGDFKLMKGQQVLATIPSQQYATPKIKVTSAERTTKGIYYTLIGSRDATINIAQNGQVIKTIKNASATTKVFIPNAKIKNSTRGLTVTQRVTNKKTSQAVQLPPLKVNIKQVTNF